MSGLMHLLVTLACPSRTRKIGRSGGKIQRSKLEFNSLWFLLLNTLKDVEYFQFMAKDNVPFHAVMFPSAQLGSGEDYTIVNHIMATGKSLSPSSMSKSNQYS